MYDDHLGFKRLGIFEGQAGILLGELGKLEHSIGWRRTGLRQMEDGILEPPIEYRSPSKNHEIFTHKGPESIVQCWHRDNFGAAKALLMWSNIYPTQVKECADDRLLENTNNKFTTNEQAIPGRDIPIYDGEVIVFDNQRYVHRINPYTDPSEERMFIRAYTTWDMIEIYGDKLVDAVRRANGQVAQLARGTRFKI